MGSEENRDGLLQERSSSNNNVINSSYSSSQEMVTNALGPYYSSSWNPGPIVSSSNHGGIFPNPNTFREGHFSDPHMIGGDSCIVLPNIANYSETARYGSNLAHKPLMDTVDSHENCQNSDNGASGSSLHHGTRRRKMSPQNGEKEDDKRVKESNSNGEEPSKANYIHVRAKRGQATNSHSLAERVRRERISERMRLLQELVPGCNKITGKAVMLDEIINYVQSLQQQVEFLSMKLATVNPVLNIDIERLLTKDIFQLQGNSTNGFGINPGPSGSSHHFLGYPQGTFNGVTQPFTNLPQHIWNNELQGILQMGFDPQPSSSSLGPNGMPK